MSMSSASVSGLSAPANPDDDLDAAVAGGPAFIARVKALKEARAEHDAALANLRLGYDVVRAMQDVQVREQSVMDATTNAEKAADEIARTASVKATEMLSAAKEQADGIITDARLKADEQSKKTDELTAQVKEGYATLSAWSEKTKAEANRMMDEVVVARQKAEAAMREAKALWSRAQEAHQAASERHTVISAWLAEHNAVVAEHNMVAAKYRAKLDGLPSLPP